MNGIIQLFEEKYELKKIDVEGYDRMKVGPMKFQIEAYDVRNVGRLSYMKGSAMFGLMKMDTIIFTSYEKDVPLLSYDRIRAGKKDTLMFEVYDTCREHKEYPGLKKAKEAFDIFTAYPLKKAWYDSIKRKESLSVTTKRKHDYEPLIEEYIKTFFDIVDDSDDISKEEKRKLNSEYVDGLLENGGASTDMFVKKIGKEKTSILFRKYLFGTED